MTTPKDRWFHAKQKAGSHVIVKTEGQELPFCFIQIVQD